MPRKKRFKEMKRRGMSRTGKNEIILTCPSAKKLRAAGLKKPPKTKNLAHSFFQKCIFSVVMYYENKIIPSVCIVIYSSDLPMLAASTAYFARKYPIKIFLGQVKCRFDNPAGDILLNIRKRTQICFVFKRNFLAKCSLRHVE